MNENITYKTDLQMGFELKSKEQKHILNSTIPITFNYSDKLHVNGVVLYYSMVIKVVRCLDSRKLFHNIFDFH